MIRARRSTGQAYGGDRPEAPALSASSALLLFLLLLLLAALLAPGCGPAAPGGAGAGGAGAHHEEGASHGAAGDGHDEHAEAEAGAVELSPEALRNGGIRAGAAGPAVVPVVVEAPGEVHLDAERVLEIRPRYAGVLREIRKRIGDSVRRGEVVAVVQSNESLADYDIVSSMSGTVIARPVVTGQAVDQGTGLLTVADLSGVWVDFAIYPQYVGRIRPGLPVTITAQNRPDLVADGTVHYVGPLLEQDTRVSSARVLLANPRGTWQPGLFVNARVTLERARVPVAVPDDALVRTAEGMAVFRAAGNRFTSVPVTVGRSDGRTTEITSGLAAGDSVVVAGAFILKSELAKGEVGHEH
jgi:cobalt-zinc-cadmium efflux system membrane fusion protein